MSALPTPPANPMLCAALAYAAAGIPVFPVRGRGKKPLTQHGFKDASTDPAQIQAWWARWPVANIGIPTGMASGWAVVDVDVKHGGDVALEQLIDQHGPIRETPESLTGGGGRHLIFRYVPGFTNSEKVLGNGIDTRGEGGYIVAPPSIHESGRTYEWEGGNSPIELAPADLPDWLHPGKAATAPAIAGAGNLDFVVGKGKANGSPAAVGSRNSTAASLAGQWIQQGDSVHTVLKKLRQWNQANAVPLPDREIQTVTASVALTHQRNNPAASIPIGDVEVPEPATVKPAKAQARRVPEDLLSPPGMVGAMCKFVTDTAYMPQPFLTVGNILAFFGAIVGRKVQTFNGLRTNPYCVGVGDSGCGKDHSRQVVKWICEAAGCMSVLGGEDVSSDTAILDAVSATPSLLFQWDEIGHMIARTTDKMAQSHQKAIAPLLTKLFSSARGKMLGKQYAKSGGQGERKDIDQPNVCFYGTTVPGRLYEGLSSREIADGFIGRILFFISDNPDPTEQDVCRQPVPQEIIDCVQRWWLWRPPPPQGMGNIEQATGNFPFTVPMDADATAAFKAFRTQCKEAKIQARATRLDPLWARAVEHATKIALIVACGENYETDVIITGTTAAWAVKLVEYLTTSLIQAVGHQVADNQHERDVLRMLDVIRRTGTEGITRNVLTRRTQWAGNAKRRIEILNDLITSEQVCKEIRSSARGTSAEVFKVNDL